MTLLDLLPAFMAMSANIIARDATSRITPQWMLLAAGLMLQATIEQYVDCGSQSISTIDEAFAWGFDPEATFQEGSDDFTVNAMFLNDTEEVAEWQSIREEHVQAVCISRLAIRKRVDTAS